MDIGERAAITGRLTVSLGRSVSREPRQHDTSICSVCVPHHCHCAHRPQHQQEILHKEGVHSVITFSVTISFQTTVTYETRNLSTMDFPMYFSLYAEPGYNSSLLRKIYSFSFLLTFFHNHISLCEEN